MYLVGHSTCSGDCIQLKSEGETAVPHRTVRRLRNQGKPCLWLSWCLMLLHFECCYLYVQAGILKLMRSIVIQHVVSCAVPYLAAYFTTLDLYAFVFLA